MVISTPTLTEVSWRPKIGFNSMGKSNVGSIASSREAHTCTGREINILKAAFSATNIDMFEIQRNLDAIDNAP